MRKFAKWLENYWYHYKWHTIVVAFLVLVLGIGVFQMATKEEYDIDILYTGPAVLSEQQASELATAFEAVMPEDFDGDGDKSAMIYDVTVLSDEQIAEKEAEAKAESDVLYYDYQNREEAISRVGTLLSTGETVICLMDDYMYQKFMAENAFVPLADLLGEAPEYALDEYSVRLMDTPFGQYFSACMALPGDTVLCIRRESVLASSSKKAAQAHYEFCVETFKNIFTFSVA